MKNPFILLSAITLASCGTQKGQTIYKIPEGFNKYGRPTASSTTSGSSKPTAHQGANRDATPATPQTSSDNSGDGLRVPNMLTLPDEDQLRSPQPVAPAGEATIITRPPSE